MYIEICILNGCNKETNKEELPGVSSLILMKLGGFVEGIKIFDTFFNHQLYIFKQWS